MNELATEIADSWRSTPPRFACDPGPSPAARASSMPEWRSKAATTPGFCWREICMGGLGNVTYSPIQVGGEAWPGLTVWTDHPAVSCMASQYAGWAISVDKFFAMGSGPLRAHARVERELFEKLDYAEEAAQGVLVLEGRTLPTDAVAVWVAEKARLQPSQLTFVVAPTASLAGGVQISARILETGLHKMETLGFDVRRVVSAMGTAPIAARGQERPARHRPDQRLHPVRRAGALHGSRRATPSWRSWRPRSRRRHPATTAHRSTRSSSGTRATSTRSIPCSSVPRKYGSRAPRAGRTFHAGHLNPEVLTASCYPS